MKRKNGGGDKCFWLMRGESQNFRLPYDLSSDSSSEFCDESLWLQKVMRGMSRSPKLLAPSANQILPSLFR